MPAIVEAAINSTERYLTHLTANGIGVALNRANLREASQAEPCFLHGSLHYLYAFTTDKHIQIQPDDALIYLPEGNGERIEVKVIAYDRRTGSLDLAFADLHESQRGQIEIDFKWLVRRTLLWFRDHGHKIATPPWEFSPSVPVSQESDFGDPALSDEQRHAIRACLSHGFSYIWGPPGSGKTQYTLALAAKQLATTGHRVLVVAPTNNAVDNALQAILKRCGPAMERRDIIRLGIPTPEFTSANPDVCEDRAVRQKLAQLQDEIQRHTEALAALQELEATWQLVSQLRERMVGLETKERDQTKKTEAHELLIEELEEECTALEQRLAEIATAQATAQRAKRSLPVLAQVLPSAARKQIEEQLTALAVEAATVSGRLNNCQAERANHLATKKLLTYGMQQLSAERNAIHVELLQAQSRHEELLGTDITPSFEEVAGLVLTISEELQAFEEKLKTLELQLSEKKVIGLTLDGFIGRSTFGGFNVDHILVDEAAYAPLIKLLPLLSLNCPISLFGDHRQLPPVCESDGGDSEVQAYWGKSALFMESAWNAPLEYSTTAAKSEPSFEQLHKADLTQSFRFADSLASVLQNRVYRSLDLVGVALEPTDIHFIDIPQQHAEDRRRVNVAEVAAICSLLEALPNTENLSVAVLTPYKHQVSAVRSELMERNLLHKAEVLNTHRAQGREWDIVLFSVVDAAAALGPFLTDSARDIGVLVLNTTISRVRRKLYLFADGSYWRGRNQLISDLITLSAVSK